MCAEEKNGGRGKLGHLLHTPGGRNSQRGEEKNLPRYKKGVENEPHSEEAAAAFFKGAREKTAAEARFLG